MKETKILTAEKFAEIFTDEEFRNQVAFAHECYSSRNEFQHLKTCSYPIEYIVTEQQKQEAEAQRLLAKKETVYKNRGKLMFVGMGSTYAERYPDDPCNHRIRTEFQGPTGRRYFIEVGTGNGENMRIDHAIDRDQRPDKFSEGSDNYKGLCRMDPIKYTKTNILELVNKYFDCKFSEIVIDNYNVSCDDFISVSPKTGNEILSNLVNL